MARSLVRSVLMWVSTVRSQVFCVFFYTLFISCWRDQTRFGDLSNVFNNKNLYRVSVNGVLNQLICVAGLFNLKCLIRMTGDGVENFFIRRSKVRILAYISRGENGLVTQSLVLIFSLSRRSIFLFRVVRNSIGNVGWSVSNWRYNLKSLIFGRLISRIMTSGICLRVLFSIGKFRLKISTVKFFCCNMQISVSVIFCLFFINQIVFRCINRFCYCRYGMIGIALIAFFGEFFIILSE